MLPLSLPVKLAWQLAAVEAVQAKHRFIECEHVLIGLLKLADITEGDILHLLEPAFPNLDVLVIQEGIAPIIEILSGSGVDKKMFRREVRHLIGLGEYTHHVAIVPVSYTHLRAHET